MYNIWKVLSCNADTKAFCAFILKHTELKKPCFPKHFLKPTVICHIKEWAGFSTYLRKY